MTNIFGPPFVKRFALCYQTVVCLSVCDVRALWPNGWTDEDETWHAGRPRRLGPGHIIRWGPSSPSPKGHSSPVSAHGCVDQDVTWHGARPRPRRLCVRWGPLPLPKFSANVYCGQTAGWMKLVLGVEVGLSPGHFVLDGDPAPSSKRGRRPPPQFSAHFYCIQTAGCIKMPLGTDAGLSPGDFVLDGDPLPSPKRGAQFSAHVYCGQTAGWIKMALCMEVGLGPSHIVLDGAPAPLPQKGADFPIFGQFLLSTNG